jgi:hypothetical protein
MIMLSLLLLSSPPACYPDTNPAAASLSGVDVDSVSQTAVLTPELAMGWESEEAPPDTFSASPYRSLAFVLAPPLDPDSGADTTRARPKAIEYSSFYYTRLTIHKYASYATIPLFVAEGIVGQKLYNSTGESSLRGTHSALAAGIGVLFGVNTVTGVWNLWEGRKNPAGRTRRMIHSVLMLVSDAGFVATASSAPHRESEGGGPVTNEGGSPSTHRTLAITSGSVALAGYLMMLFWKD